MKHIIQFNDYKIYERLTEINDDVDWIYEKYFKEGLDYIQENDKIDIFLFKKDSFSSSELISPQCKKAHKINPITIHINDKPNSSNHYNPFDKLISLRVNSNAINFCSDFNSVSDAINYLDDEKQKKNLSLEFKESSIKGSIHHELVHWIDDTINNQHIKNKLIKQKETGIRIKNVNFTDFELQSQIHNIVQLKRKYEKEWDYLDFDDMIMLSPSLTVVSTNIDFDAKQDWIFRLKKRMAREGLLGKKMYN